MTDHPATHGPWRGLNFNPTTNLNRTAQLCPEGWLEVFWNTDDQKRGPHLAIARVFGVERDRLIDDAFYDEMETWRGFEPEDCGLGAWPHGRMFILRLEWDVCDDLSCSSELLRAPDGELAYADPLPLAECPRCRQPAPLFPCGDCKAEMCETCGADHTPPECPPAWEAHQRAMADLERIQAAAPQHLHLAVDGYAVTYRLFSTGGPMPSSDGLLVLPPEQIAELAAGRSVRWPTCADPLPDEPEAIHPVESGPVPASRRKLADHIPPSPLITEAIGRAARRLDHARKALEAHAERGAQRIREALAGDDRTGAQVLADIHEGLLEEARALAPSREDPPPWATPTREPIDPKPAIRAWPAVGCVLEGADGPFLTIDLLDGGDVAAVHIGDVVAWANRQRRDRPSVARDEAELRHRLAELGGDLRPLRERHGVTLGQLARALGTTPAVLSAFELGEEPRLPADAGDVVRAGFELGVRALAAAWLVEVGPLSRAAMDHIVADLLGGAAPATEPEKLRALGLLFRRTREAAGLGVKGLASALGVPTTTIAAIERAGAPADAQPGLHPTGACTCADEGRCAWCRFAALDPDLVETAGLELHEGPTFQQMPDRTQDKGPRLGTLVGDTFVPLLAHDALSVTAKEVQQHQAAVHAEADRQRLAQPGQVEVVGGKSDPELLARLGPSGAGRGRGTARDVLMVLASVPGIVSADVVDGTLRLEVEAEAEPRQVLEQVLPHLPATMLVAVKRRSGEGSEVLYQRRAWTENEGG